MEKSDKTCRSCNFYNNKHHICLLRPDVIEIQPDDFCVSSWEPRKKETNRVRLTGLTNQKIAELWSKQAFLFAWCYDCPEFCKDGDCNFDQERCEHQVNNWLEADFTEQMNKESEGKDE